MHKGSKEEQHITTTFFVAVGEVGGRDNTDVK